MRPDSFPRLWRYINLLLTYLLTNVSKNNYHAQRGPGWLQNKGEAAGVILRLSVIYFLL